MEKALLTLAVLGILTLFGLGQSSGDSSSNAGHQTATAYGDNDPTHGRHAGFKVEFENDAVQVLRINLGPHEKIPMHEITPRVVVLLTDQDLRVTLPNGETREEHHKAGESMWVPGGRHSGENLSDKPIEFIAVVPRTK